MNSKGGMRGAVWEGPLRCGPLDRWWMDEAHETAMDAPAASMAETGAVAAHLGLQNVQEFADDVVNAVNDYVADGFDALER